MEADRDKENTSDTLIGKAEEYINTRIELLKLKAVDKISDSVSSFITTLIIIIVFFPFIILLNIGLSLWIGNELENVPLGFFIIGAVYLLIGIILYVTRNKWLKPAFANMIIKNLLK